MTLEYPMNDIRNCEFRFKCPRQWDALKPTEDKDQRYCHECNQIVYFCHTAEELMIAIKEDRCVAINLAGPLAEDTMVGMPAPQYNINN